MPQPILCPHCHQPHAQIVGERLACEHDEIPEGLVGVSLAQCQEMTCLYEFEVVTRSHILRSLARWSSVAPSWQ
jgi:hypothetical protein